jgi:hypothetical protein
MGLFAKRANAPILALPMTNPFEIYLDSLEDHWRGGKATEHTCRSSLETLIKSLASGIKASNDPKHIACGAPDFIVERGAHSVPLGYVETTNIGADLEKVEKTDQLKRHKESLNNLILTDYLEFRWYVSGQPKLTTRIATIGKGKKLQPDLEGIALTQKLVAAFFETEVPTVGAPQDLAKRMARIAQFVRELIVKSLTADIDAEHDALDRQHLAFREHLLPTLKAEEFADIYAQTMAYGLFAAKLSAPAPVAFSRAVAYQYLAANRFLRRLFLDVGEELDGTPIAPHLDDLAALLAHADIPNILKDFGKRTRAEDSVAHFYETFLATYDPHLRKSRGVYYTPEPAVQFIVHSVNWLLQTRFERPLGLAAPDVNVLDPATGTSTFLYFVIRTIYENLLARGQAGQWPAYVHADLLPRLHGFELLIAPYVIAHLKLSLLLRELGYALGKTDRIKVFLTNALDEGVIREETLGDLGSYITHEANDAAQVKKHTPIMVVLGNPPYSGHSANASKTAEGHLNFIGQLVRDYYFVDGGPLSERNPKWLQDDYVKFIRLAQWRIQQTGHGIAAFITNHGYLDNPTFRGMRLHLLKDPRLDNAITTFPVSGNNVVEKVRCANQQVWINATQHFGGLPENIWLFQVGGYQVCEKWLKDRKGRALSAEDLRHYQRVVVALKETLRLMTAIDQAIPGWPLP